MDRTHDDQTIFLGNPNTLLHKLGLQQHPKLQRKSKAQYEQGTSTWEATHAGI
jgi:hypothetical protein